MMGYSEDHVKNIEESCPSLWDASIKDWTYSLYDKGVSDHKVDSTKNIAMFAPPPTDAPTSSSGLQHNTPAPLPDTPGSGRTRAAKRGNTKGKRATDNDSSDSEKTKAKKRAVLDRQASASLKKQQVACSKLCAKMLGILSPVIIRLEHTLNVKLTEKNKLFVAPYMLDACRQSLSHLRDAECQWRGVLTSASKDAPDNWSGATVEEHVARAKSLASDLELMITLSSNREG